jgi:hypothetical protein
VPVEDLVAVAPGEGGESFARIDLRLTGAFWILSFE